MAKVIRQDHVEVRLVSASQNLSGHFQLGVHFKIDPEWHVYWKNPGDSGSAPKFQLSGGEIKSIQWPYPVRLPVGDLTNYGYDHEVVFLLDVHTVSAPLKLNLEWLVCKVECIPGFGEIEITEKNVSVEPDLVSKFQRRIPQKGNWKARFDSKSSEALNFEFDLTENEISKIKNIFVFPENSEAFQTGLPKVEPLQKSLKVSVPISSNANFQSKTESFTFVVHDLNDEVRTFFQEIPVQKPPPSIFLGMLFAFLGGVILNLMPCVFPVLFLKAFSFLKEKDTAAIRKSSWQYSLGVVVSFLAFGGLLVILRFSGEAIGWGYQLQNPWLVYLLSLLFFVMGLNFYGFFEVGNNLVLQASKVSGNKFFSGSFGTGVLAVIVASPCTAPFMGSALGLALLLPAHLSILIFLSLGVGMALPMLMLAYVPKLIEKLPRSGQWMIVVKQLMSFPLFATCLWLLWVLGNQKGSDAIFVSLGSFLVFVLAVWILSVSQKSIWKIFAVVLLVAAPIASVFQIRSLQLASTSTVEKSAWIPYDEKVLSEKRATQPIFVDFTASWCITCQVNKRSVLNTKEIQDLFRENNVLLMQADWTNHDPIITKALARFDRNSVPLYVFYLNNAEPIILPEILTKEMIRNLFKK